MLRRFTHAVGLVTFLLVPPLSLAGDGLLRIVVLDPSGATTPNAQVSVEQHGRQALATITDLGGEALFVSVNLGKARVVVRAYGFNVWRSALKIAPGENYLEVRLRIPTHHEKVEIRPDRREETLSNPAGGLFTVLTEEQINNLPDDPEEMKIVLERMAGPRAVIRVDGFFAQRLPPKSQIASIRIRLSSYSAEDHDLGFAVIDVRTKPGLGGWHGTLAFDYSDSELGARDFFAPVRGPAQYRHASSDVSGPIWRGRTSLSFWFLRGFSYESSTAHGVTLAGPFSDIVQTPVDSSRIGARLLHELTARHHVMVEYDHFSQDGAQIGQFDLPERLVNTSQTSNIIRLADYAVPSSHALNDLRFQASWSTRRSFSLNSSPTLVVNGAFSSGGGAEDDQKVSHSFLLADDFHYGLRAHGLSAGLQIDFMQNQDQDLSNSNGTFIFTDLTTFQAGLPSQYSRLIGNTPVQYCQYQIGGYLQDEFRVKQNFSLSAGVRWEAQTHVRDYWNFGPRVGFAWSPSTRSKVTLRGGAGVFYQWIPADVYGQTLRFNGINQNLVLILNPGYPDPTQGGSEVLLPPTVYLHDYSLSLPELLRASMAVQRPVGPLMITTEIRWEHGTHLLWLNNLNEPLPGIGRPSPNNGNIYEIQNGASSLDKEWFTSLTGSAKSFSWMLNYTLAVRRNEVDGTWQPPSNPLNLQSDWGPAANDVRHQLNTYFRYFAPKGFRLALFPSYSSGQPYNITTGQDNNGDTIFNDRPVGVGRNSERGAANWSFDGRLTWTRSFGPESSSKELSREMHIDPASHGVSDLEMTTHKYQIQIYSQALNVLNHPNFLTYDGILASPEFGKPTAALQGRRLEFGLSFLF